MRVWRCELYADKALTMPCVAIYVKAVDFIGAVDLVNFSAMNFAIVCHPALPVEVEPWQVSFPPDALVRFIPIVKLKPP